MPLGAFSYTQSHFQPVDRIGRYCSIAPNVGVLGDSHPIGWATTSPIAYHTRRRRIWGVTAGAALLFDAAGATVTRDVAPYTIVAGLPARPIRPRFDDALRDALMAGAWWQYHWNDLADLPADDPGAFADGVLARADSLSPLIEDRRTIQGHLDQL